MSSSSSAVNGVGTILASCSLNRSAQTFVAGADGEITFTTGAIKITNKLLFTIMK
jgi:hypothetical protein